MLQYSLAIPDNQLYQDLSSFIQIFRRSITAAQLLSLTFEKGLSLSSSLNTAWTIIEEISQLTLRLTRKSTFSVEQMTFGRFLYRLIEIIANCKVKYQYTVSLPHDEALERFLKEAEAVARSGSETQGMTSFLSIINLTKLILLKYCNKVICSFDGGTTGQTGPTQGGILQEICIKLKQQYIKVKENQKINRNRVFFLIANTEHEKQCQKSIIETKETHKLPTSQYLSHYFRTFSDLRKRVDKYAGMDLDFSFFRDSFFEAKSNYDLFYRNYLNRNSDFLNNIGTYHDDFQGYLKRKEQKNLRKDKIDKESTHLPRDSLQVVILDQHEPTIRINPVNSPPFGDRNMISVNIVSVNPKNNGVDSLRRVKDRNTKENIQSRDTSKIKQKKTHQIFTNIGSPIKNLQIDHENSLYQNQPSVHRIKTETDKAKTNKIHHYTEQSPQHNSFRYTVGKTFLSNMGKVSLKMKYFEMKCLPEVPADPGIRGRMMLNHKFCIKHSTRNKSNNWLDKKIDR